VYVHGCTVQIFIYVENMRNFGKTTHENGLESLQTVVFILNRAGIRQNMKRDRERMLGKRRKMNKE